MRPTLFILTAISILVQGCVSYGESIKSDFASLRDVPCQVKSNEMFLFMENEPLDFEYEKIGIIEIQGAEYSKLTEVMDELKYQAWSNCANGIINVSQSNTFRESGSAFVDGTERTYSSKVFTGIAVSIEVDEAFIEANQSNEVDMNFIPKVEKRQAQATKKANTEMNVSLITGVVGLIVILIASA